MGLQNSQEKKIAKILLLFTHFTKCKGRNKIKKLLQRVQSINRLKLVMEVFSRRFSIHVQEL